MTAFVDLPPSTHRAGTEFWAALEAGAEFVMESSFAVTRSPGGFTFAFVSGTGDEHLTAPARNDGAARECQPSFAGVSPNSIVATSSSNAPSKGPTP